MQGDIGRAAAAARVGDESDAQVNRWRTQRERSRGEAGFTAQNQRVVASIRLELENGPIAQGAGETASRRQAISRDRQTALIKGGVLSGVEFQRGATVRR